MKEEQHSQQALEGEPPRWTLPLPGYLEGSSLPFPGACFAFSLILFNFINKKSLTEIVMIPHVSIRLRILQSTLKYFIFFDLHNDLGSDQHHSPLEMKMRPREVKDLLRSHSKLVIEWQHKLCFPNPSPGGSSHLKSERKGTKRQASE